MEKSKFSEENKGYLFILAAGSLWGSIGLFSTMLTDAGLSSGTVAFIRVFASSVMLAAALLIKGRGVSLFKISKRGLVSCMLVGLISQSCFNLCYMSAIEQGGMSTAAVLLYTSPVYVALLSKIFFNEPLSGRKIIAIFINIAGCILTVTGGDFSDVKISGFGIAMGLLAGFTYALLPILSRTGADKENAYTASFYGQMFGALLLMLILRPWSELTSAFSMKLLLISMGFGIIPSAMAYIVYYEGIGRIKETSRIPVLASVETVVASVIGLICFSQRPGAVKLLGILLVLCSIAVMNSNKRVIPGSSYSDD